MIKKDIRYIIKRIIIGVGIALILMSIKGKLLLQTYAEVIQFTPNHANIVTSSVYTATVIDSGSWASIPVYAFSSNTPTDWQGYASIQYNYSGSNYYCTQTNNIATLKGSFVSYLAIPNATVSRYSSGSGTQSCDFSIRSGGIVDFTCYNINTSSMFNLNLNNVPGSNYGVSKSLEVICNYDTEQAVSDIINNQNNNTSNIINNQNNNTQSIIDNQNQNTQDMIDSQKVCSTYDSSSIVRNGAYLSSNGSIISHSPSTEWGITDFIKISSSSTIKRFNSTGASPSSCFYNTNKSLISCVQNNVGTQSNYIFTIPNGSEYVRFSIRPVQNRPQFEVCSNGNQALNDTLNDDNVSSSLSESSSFFNNFTVNSHGLSGIITSPLRLLNTFTTATCTPLSFQLPFVHNTVVLPCIKPIIEDYFGLFFSLYQLITTGLISYHVLINIYSKVRDLQDPNKDRIEVLNL